MSNFTMRAPEGVANFTTLAHVTYDVDANNHILVNGADVNELAAAGFLVVMKAPAGTASVSISGPAPLSCVVDGGVVNTDLAHVSALAALGFIVAGGPDDTNIAPTQRPGSPVITGNAYRHSA